jgi:hypothetical protein
MSTSKATNCKRPTPTHEVDEDRPSTLVELHDLTVEHRVVGVQDE